MRGILILIILLVVFTAISGAEKYSKKSNTEMEISEITLPPVSATLGQLEDANNRAQANLERLETQYREAKERLQKEKGLAQTRVNEAVKLGIKKLEETNGK